MSVLAIILAVVVAILIYMLTQKIDSYTYSKYKYEFFTTEKFIAFFALTVTVVFFANTKPVYNIN